MAIITLFSIVQSLSQIMGVMVFPISVMVVVIKEVEAVAVVLLREDITIMNQKVEIWATVGKVLKIVMLMALITTMLVVAVDLIMEVNQVIMLAMVVLAVVAVVLMEEVVLVMDKQEQPVTEEMLEVMVLMAPMVVLVV